jgi:nucleotide-binding universal stress UspA family protein
MYRHLLVPIDDSDLSTLTIGRAVEFARTLGASVTFFHADADYASSLRGEADVVRLTAPDAYTYLYEGRARELLTKAESAARAQGVPCSSRTAVSDSPYTAIIAAARTAGCDLIFMASHGRRSTIGMMLGSQTLKVLIHSEIPVLVSAMVDPPAPAQAIATIRDEHRSPAAVLHAWLQVLKPGADGQAAAPEPALMRGMVYYRSTPTVRPARATTSIACRSSTSSASRPARPPCCNSATTAAPSARWSARKTAASNTCSS